MSIKTLKTLHFIGLSLIPYMVALCIDFIALWVNKEGFALLKDSEGKGVAEIENSATLVLPKKLK